MTTREELKAKVDVMSEHELVALNQIIDDVPRSQSPPIDRSEQDLTNTSVGRLDSQEELY